MSITNALNKAAETVSKGCRGKQITKISRERSYRSQKECKDYNILQKAMKTERYCYWDFHIVEKIDKTEKDLELFQKIAQFIQQMTNTINFAKTRKKDNKNKTS